MLEVFIKNIPDYLKKSDHYKNLKKKSNKKIAVPHMKNDDVVNSLEDLENYLKTADFWLLDIEKYISKSALKYIHNNLHESLPIMLNINYFKHLFEYFDFDLNFDFSKLRENETITVNYKNNWEIEIEAIGIFEDDESNDFFKDIYKKIEKDEIFEETFVSNHENSSHEIYVRKIIFSYDNKIFSLKKVVSSGKSFKDQSPETVEFILKIPVNLLNKKKLIKNLKNAYHDYNKVYEMFVQEMEDENNYE